MTPEKEYNFDRVDLGGARNMGEADFFLNKHKGIACRQEVYSPYKEKWKAFFNKVMMRKGEGEL